MRVDRALRQHSDCMQPAGVLVLWGYCCVGWTTAVAGVLVVWVWVGCLVFGSVLLLLFNLLGCSCCGCAWLRV